MDTIDLKKLWHLAQKSAGEEQFASEAKIYQFRKLQAKSAIRSSRWSIKFDIYFKLLIAISYVPQLFIADSANHQIAKWLLCFTCLLLVAPEIIILKKHQQLRLGDSILSHLQEQLNFLQTAFKIFIYLAALTNPLFMTSGFFWYDYFKYGAIQLSHPFETPVLYVFLLAGFLVSLLSSYPIVRTRISDLRTALLELDDGQLADRKIIAQKRRRWRRIIIAAIFLLAGLLVLLIFLLHRFGG